MLLLLLACQEPFNVQRKDLGPLRIAAMGVEEGVARAAVWSGEGLFHSQTPTLTWSLDGQTLGEGFQVAVPGEGSLELQVESGGEVLYGTVQIGVGPTLTSFERLAVEVDEVDLEARLELAEAPLTAPSEDVRIRLESDASVVRWMSAGGEGTLMELEEQAADVLGEELVFDDGEVLERSPLEPAVLTQLVLLMDGEGGNSWTWIDVPSGLDPSSFVEHQGRLIASEDSGLLGATIGPEGNLEELAPALIEEHEATCGPAPFELSWLVEGRCGLDQVQGQRVVFETW